MTDEQIIEIASFVLALLAGFGVPNLIDWLKATLNFSGHRALAVTAAVATVIAILELIVEGRLSAGVVNWEGLPAVFMLVFGASQARFRMLRDRKLGETLAQSVYEANYNSAAAMQLAEDAMARTGGQPHGLADEGNHRD